MTKSRRRRSPVKRLLPAPVHVPHFLNTVIPQASCVRNVAAMLTHQMIGANLPWCIAPTPGRRLDAPQVIR